jgi:hypothetical protein
MRIPITMRRMSDMFTITVKEVTCPKCGAEEMHPNGEQLLIRGFKVYNNGKWRSQCLVCSGAYDKDLKMTNDHNPNKGWF